MKMRSLLLPTSLVLLLAACGGGGTGTTPDPDPNQPDPKPPVGVTQCNAQGDQFINRTIDGDVEVPEGAFCNLSDSTVTGKVTIKSNAKAILGGTIVKGDVHGTNVLEAKLTGTNVGGSVAIDGGRVVIVADAKVMRDVELKNVTQEAKVAGSTIGGDLKCSGNIRVDGGGNQVSGSKTGQCSTL